MNGAWITTKGASGSETGVERPKIDAAKSRLWAKMSQSPKQLGVRWLRFRRDVRTEVHRSTSVADEQKSVTREIAKAYARRMGWTAVEEHVYVDDGISGAEFADRPGFLRLMNALKPRPPFQVLVTSEESRLGPK